MQFITTGRLSSNDKYDVYRWYFNPHYARGKRPPKLPQKQISNIIWILILHMKNDYSLPSYSDRPPISSISWRCRAAGCTNCTYAKDYDFNPHLSHEYSISSTAVYHNGAAILTHVLSMEHGTAYQYATGRHTGNFIPCLTYVWHAE